MASKTLHEVLFETGQAYLCTTLDESKTIAEAAAKAGLNRTQFYCTLRRYNIEVDHARGGPIHYRIKTPDDGNVRRVRPHVHRGNPQ